jgi:hypothetical protein
LKIEIQRDVKASQKNSRSIKRGKTFEARKGGEAVFIHSTTAVYLRFSTNLAEITHLP